MSKRELKKNSLVGSLTIGDRKYTIQDSQGFVKLEQLELPKGWYGGRVTQLAKTDKEGIYLCLEGMTPINIYITDEADLGKSAKAEKQITVQE